MESLEELELRIQELERKSFELKQQRDAHKSNCCNEICSIFKEESSNIEQQLLQIDSKAYDKYNMFLKWYYPFTKKEPKDPHDKKVWEKHMKGKTREEFLEHAFKSKEIRNELVKSFYKSTKALDILNRKDNIEHLLIQLELNNICQCSEEK